MHRRTIGRAATAALTVLLLAGTAARADTVPADGDQTMAGDQLLVALDDAAPGAVVTWPVTFRLICAGLSHVQAGATVALVPDSATVPLDGAVDATTTTIGPVPATWTPDDEGCPTPAPVLLSNAPSVVSLTMPTTPGDDYVFTLSWARQGASGLTGTTAISFVVDVVANTPPVLTLPGDLSAEATSAAGAAVTWTASAQDAEDATSPTPSCVPASGSTFGLGTTTVTCTVTDGGGLSDSGSFSVTVGDTTAPSLSLPATRSATTSDPSGTAVSYPPPTAVDVVDPDPTVACVPASGEHFAIGTTRVDCTATDDAGNTAVGSFDVEVAWVDSVEWSVVWGEPVGNGDETFVANAGRTVPFKAEIFADGVEQTGGTGLLSVRGCDERLVADFAMSWDGGRWVTHLDTGLLRGPGCYEVTAILDGHATGSVGMELRRDGATSDRTPGAVRGEPDRAL